MLSLNYHSRFIRVLERKRTFRNTPLTVFCAGATPQIGSVWLQYGKQAALEALPLHGSPAENAEAFAAIGPQADFIQLDAGGGELELLKALEPALASGSILGVEAAVRFHVENGGISDLERFFFRHGYRLYDLSLGRSSDVALHYPVAGDHRDASGAPIFGPTIHGALTHGRAVFLPDIASDLFCDRSDQQRDGIRLLKLASLFELYTLADCAARLLLDYEGTVDKLLPVEDLLDLLVPDYYGERIPYKEYNALYLKHIGRPKSRARGLIRRKQAA